MDYAVHSLGSQPAFLPEETCCLLSKVISDDPRGCTDGRFHMARLILGGGRKNPWKSLSWI
jgi:hypothetical protein